MDLIQKMRSGRKGIKSIGSMVKEVSVAIESMGIPTHMGKSVVTGISTEHFQEFETINQTLSTSLESLQQQLGMTVSVESNYAAVIASMGAQDPMAYARAGLMTKEISSEDNRGNRTTVVDGGVINQMAGGGAMFERMAALEAYDERDNKNAAAYSVVYNMQASRQDEFGETLFPTIVVSPDNAGISITVRLMLVMDAITRDISGAVAAYNKKNIIRAVADYTILQNDQTKVVPVVRPQALANFVSPTLVAPYNTIVAPDAASISTAPLATGVTFDLLGLSATDAILAAGTPDFTDSLDQTIQLTNLYVSVTGAVPSGGGAAPVDVLTFPTTNLPYSIFNNSIQQNYRQMVLNFTSTSLLVNATTLQTNGAPLSVLAAIGTDNVIVRLGVRVTGSVNIERGDTVVDAGAISVFSVTNATTGLPLDLTTGVGLSVVQLFASAKIFGYDLLAYRTNMNRRQRGQLIDTTFQTQIYNVPLRAPITAVRPVTTDGQNDASDLAALITATHIRTSNQAVTALLQAASVLSQYVDVRDTTDEGPDVMGVSRYLVRATYEQASLDMATLVDSLSSHKRAEDIQAALMNQVRDRAYRMYRDSEFKAAADAMSGGVSVPPVVIVATDPVLARYLQVTGDNRSLGNGFEMRVISTLDKRMSGKIIITFGAFDGEQNAGPNPLHFGCMAWKPELTLTLPISRNNQISKELTVQPAFLHIVNLPIMAVLDIANVPSVVGKVAVNFHSV